MEDNAQLIKAIVHLNLINLSICNIIHTFNLNFQKLYFGPFVNSYLSYQFLWDFSLYGFFLRYLESIYKYYRSIFFIKYLLNYIKKILLSTMILNKNPCPTNTKKKKKPEATIFTIFMFLNFRITQVLVLLKIKNFLWFAYQKLAVMLADYEQAFME